MTTTFLTGSPARRIGILVAADGGDILAQMTCGKVGRHAHPAVG